MAADDRSAMARDFTGKPPPGNIWRSTKLHVQSRLKDVQKSRFMHKNQAVDIQEPFLCRIYVHNAGHDVRLCARFDRRPKR